MSAGDLTVVALVSLAGYLGWYAVGLRRVLRHPQGRRRYTGRTALLALAILVGLGSTMSSLGEELENRLSTHMVQHLALIVVVAPLLVLAAPGPVLLAGLPGRARRRIVRRLRRTPTLGLLTPHAAWGVHIAALWLWHLPAPFDAAVTDEAVHQAEHATFLATAWLFWWHLFRAGRHRLRGPAGLLYLMAAVPAGAALGAVLTFAHHPLYPAQGARSGATEAQALSDQRLAGLVMWVPLDFAYVALALWLFGRWLARTGAGDRRQPTLADLPPDVVGAVRTSEGLAR